MSTTLMTSDLSLAAWTQPDFQRLPWCFSVRAVPRSAATHVQTRKQVHPGDVVLAEVVRIGQHRRLQLEGGRYRALNVGDLFVAAAGCRYAVDQFEGRGDFGANEPCALLAGGGVVGVLEAQHGAMSAATEVRIIGVLQTAEGKRVRLSSHSSAARGQRPARVIGVVGSGMNAGKTTAAAALIRGLHRSGLRVAGIKATGTGSFGDVSAYEDSGAHWVGDFGLMGMASTYRQPIARLSDALDGLLTLAAQQDCDVAVVELADGLLQTETAALLQDPGARAQFDQLLYAAADALSGVAGIDQLERWGHKPMGVSGLITRAPLAVRELQSARTAEVWTRDQLADPAVANALMVRMIRQDMNH